jgi:jumonji domain-containing protein 7
MGDGRSVSSMHKDHYENIYAVVQGEKHFTLIPPSYYPFLCEGRYIHRKWKTERSALDENSDDMGFFIEQHEPGQENFVDWISINADSPRDIEMFKVAEQLNGESYQKYHVVLEKGDVLYLPSLWYHQVAQYAAGDGFINAINFWWDMDYSKSYPTFSTLKSLMYL